MRAVQYTAPGKIEWVRVPDPEPPAGGLVLRVLVAAICGSDLHFLHDSPPESYPWEPGQSGHECVAVVEESAAEGIPRGVFVLALVPRFNGFAEYVTALPEEVIRLPDGLSPDRGVLAQQLGTVVYCCRKLRSVIGKRIVVVGQGPAGLLFTMLLRGMGAHEIYGLDIIQRRLELSSQLGATRTVDLRCQDPVQAVRESTGGAMADLVVEAVGKAETINLCPELVREHGDIALFGVPKMAVMPIAMEAFLRKNMRVVTSVYAQREPGLASFRLAVDLIAQGRLDPSSLVSHRLPFACIQQGFDLAETKRDDAVKVLLDY